MENLVYLLAEFSTEFLLILALLIFILVCVYAGFWILNKRRYGVIESQLPAGPVKAYLNEMIFNAEQLRAQLFGLLGQSLPPSGSSWAGPVTQVQHVGDPNAAGKLSELEGKLAEQLKALDSLNQTKAQLEKDLNEARQKIGAPAAGNQNISEIKKMDDKIKNLESRLAEYNVIEDDLANLKRFQQENVQLRKALAAAGVATPTSNLSSKTPPPDSTPTDSTPDSDAGGEPPASAGGSAASSEAAEESASASTDQGLNVPAENPEFEPALPEAVEEKDATPLEAPADVASDDAFSQLTQQVSKEMAPPASKAQAAPPLVPEPSMPSPSPGGGSNDKSEEDLVAEFEKMLKG